MVRPKAGTKGGDAASEKWRQTMINKYGVDGVHKKMQEMGRKGGKNGKGPDYKGGFAGDRELAKRAGRKAGTISKRGYKFIRQEEGFREYLDKKTGKVVQFPV